MQYFLLFKKDTITLQQDSKFLSSEWAQLSDLQTNKPEIYISKGRHIQRVRLAGWLAHPTKSSVVGLGSLTHPLCLELEISLDAWCAHVTQLCRIKGVRNQKSRFATTCTFVLTFVLPQHRTSPVCFHLRFYRIDLQLNP